MQEPLGESCLLSFSCFFFFFFGKKGALLEDPPSQTTASMACWTHPWLES